MVVFYRIMLLCMLQRESGLCIVIVIITTFITIVATTILITIIAISAIITARAGMSAQVDLHPTSFHNPANNDKSVVT